MVPICLICAFGSIVVLIGSRLIRSSIRKQNFFLPIQKLHLPDSNSPVKVILVEIFDRLKLVLFP